MPSTYAHDERKRREDRRLARLRGRIALVSSLGFATLFALAAQHSIGTSKHHATRLVRRTVAASAQTPFFDEQADGYTFANTAAEPSPVPAEQPAQAVTPSPPVAQTSVS